MAEDGSTVERPRLDQKLFAKHSWRGKLFPHEAKKAEKKSEADNNVADFLKSATNKQSKPHPDISIPRIDTSAASRWPAAVDVTQSSGSQYQGRNQRSTDPPRVKKGKGLSVKFTSADPVIIGEGGDESEMPPRVISQLKARSLQTLPKGGGLVHDGDSFIGTEHQPASELSGERSGSNQASEGSFRPQPLRRTPTGISEIEDWSPTDYGSPVSPIELSHSESPRPGTLANMRFEEGRALHNAACLPSPPPPVYAANNSKPNVTEAPLSSSAIRSLADLEPAQIYPLQPSPSPRLSSHSPIPLQGVNIPSVLVPGGPRHSTHVIPLKSNQAIGSPVEAVLGDDQKSPSLSLRSAVNAIRDDALEQFSSRVEHYNSIFHLAAERLKPIMETSFVEWVRAGIWWFLKGRGELETAIRSRPGSADGNSATHRETARPLQAYVNLAKAWWIIRYITPQHPELRRFGNASMDAMAAIVRNVGDEDFAQLIEVHQAIVASLRALTMSMKRNDLLPPYQDQNPLGPGLDTNIWIQYPFFTPEIQSLLSSNVPRSMILETSSKSRSLSDTMPLSDTKRCLSYGRKFVEVTLSSNDDQSQAFRFPCVASIMRDRTDWQIEVVIASQNGLVNISIQPDKKLGLSWSEVQWEIRSYGMRVGLSRGFELYVQFSQVDFKMIWEMYEYTQKLETSLQAGPGEEILYENTLKDFQYVDPRPSKAFPPEPSKRCRLLLFESKKTRSEPTGRRQRHSGYRLAVVTSPKVKTVSSVCHVLGNKRPILFSYLRGEDGAPALLLKIPEDKGTFTLVMTFHETTERTELHSLLNGTAIKNDEACDSTMQLIRFSIERILPAGERLASGSDALKAFEWQQLRVIKKDWENLDQLQVHNLLTEKLRICMECRYGTITDHVNLGQFATTFQVNITDIISSGRLTPQPERTCPYGDEDFTSSTRRSDGVYGGELTSCWITGGFEGYSPGSSYLRLNPIL